MLAARNCLKTGLNVDPQFDHLYMIARAGKATVTIGYKGLMELARRSRKVWNVQADLVYENDIFEYERGLEVKLRHIPYWINGAAEPGDLKAGYVIWDSGMGIQVCVVPRKELERRRNCSPMKDGPAWVEHPGPMYRKSAIREAATFWPLSPELAHALKLDTAADLGQPQGTDEDLAEIIPAEAISNGEQSFRQPLVLPEQK